MQNVLFVDQNENNGTEKKLFIIYGLFMNSLRSGFCYLWSPECLVA